MPTVLVRDLLWRISDALKDRSPQFTRWTQHELVGWLNDIQLLICDVHPEAGARRDTVRLVAGPLQSIASIAVADVKTGDGVVPSVPIRGRRVRGVHRNMTSNGTVAGRAIRGPIDRKTLDASDPDWPARSDTAISCYLFDPAKPTVFEVTPAVTGTVWANISYDAFPVPIPNPADNTTYLAGGVSAQTITIGDEYEPDLFNGVLGLAHLKDSKYADKSAAQFHGGLLLQSLQSKVQAAGQTNPNLKRWPMQPSPAAMAS